MLNLALVLAAQLATAPPEIVTGADLVRVCKSTELDEGIYCLAYIAGIHDTIRDLQGIDEATNIEYCLPARASIGAVSDAVAQHISDDESLWTSRAAGATLVSLMTLYPCV